MNYIRLFLKDEVSFKDLLDNGYLTCYDIINF
jgi:hypothetical protein